MQQRKKNYTLAIMAKKNETYRTSIYPHKIMLLHKDSAATFFPQFKILILGLPKFPAFIYGGMRDQVQ